MTRDLNNHLLTIDNGKLVAMNFNDETDVLIITTTEELRDAIHAGCSATSSSIDFPQEFTSDPVVLNLIDWLCSARQ